MIATVIVKSDVPDPVIDFGLKVPVTPLGMPVAEKVTTPLKPPDADTFTNPYALCPWRRPPALGESEMLKFPVAAAVTVRVTVAV